MSKMQSHDINFEKLFQGTPVPELVVQADAPNYDIINVNEAYLTSSMTLRKDLVGWPFFKKSSKNPLISNSAHTKIISDSFDLVVRSKKVDIIRYHKVLISKKEKSKFETRY